MNINEEDLTYFPISRTNTDNLMCFFYSVSYCKELSFS